MCAATAAAVAGTVATVASVGMSVASQTGALGGGSSGGGSGAISEQQLKGFAPTKGLQSYAARLLALNATATRPSLQEFAQSGGTAKYPINDPGFTPEEAANLSIVDPHTGRAEPYVSKDQTSLTPAQQVFLGQQRARQGATGPLAQLGKLTARQQNLQARGQTAGVAGSAAINKKLGSIGTKLTNVNTKLSSGGGGFPSK